MKAWFSGLTLLMQVLLIVAGVLVFAWFDPFDIFTNTKLTIRDTPSQVRQIKEIGELITAEYYGEVISSFYDIEQKQAKEKKNKLQLEVEAIDSVFTAGLNTIWKLGSEKEQLRQFNTFCDKLDEEQRFFSPYLDVLKDKLGIGFFNGKKAFLEKLSTYNISDEKLVASRIKDVMNNKEVKRAKAKIDDKVDKKKQLILLARVKVQAGFKFDKLDSRNVRVDTLHNRIIIIGFTPKILSCTINPWFIPELGIKGFEIIDMAGKGDEVKIFNKVKASCKDSLQMKAIQSNILEKATKNAEQNLQNLFAILLNNKDVKVTITPNELEFYSNTLLESPIITLKEIAVLDTVLDKHYKANDDTTQITKIFNKLASKKVVIDSLTINLSNLKTCDSLLGKYFSNKQMLAQWQKKRSIKPPI